MEFNPSEHPHRRYNPLTRTWVLVSPHRTKRPWQGAVDEKSTDTTPEYAPQCYLCPGNDRAGGAATNPCYADTFIYDNDFPALLIDSPSGRHVEHGLLVSEPERGVCRVICYSPKHNLSLSLMDTPAIRKVVDVWAGQFQELGARDYIDHVQIFENREGNSSPHPHCQIWATERIPQDPEVETEAQSDWLEQKGTDLLGDYLALELKLQERLICGNEHFVALVPYWAVWPYESMILPRRRFATLPEAASEERDGLADILHQLTVRYDNLFKQWFPYSMGIHQAPTDDGAHPEWRLHLHFTSTVLRSIEIPKHMVGYERLAEPQRDFTPEYAAKRLRELPAEHYRQRKS